MASGFFVSVRSVCSVVDEPGTTEGTENTEIQPSAKTRSLHRSGPEAGSKIGHIRNKIFQIEL
jgi:hypothetical protein